MDENANAVNMFGTKLRQKLSYTTEIKRYCDCYVIEKDQAEFSKVMAKENIWKALKDEERSKRLEKEKQDAIDANEMKSRFLSSISHDIRTPINGILGMLRIADTYSNMDGLQATKQIRDMNRPDALAIPIVAMSANAFEEDIKKSLESGMNTHLIKPLDGKKVTDTMKKYLANKIIK